jgi:hypothetical protein
LKEKKEEKMLWSFALFLILVPALAFIVCSIAKDRRRTKELQSALNNSRLAL